MAILTTEAVVLKGWKMGETSKILSFFTRDFGKVRVIAKGGRNPKSPFKGCLESLTHISAMYYHKATRELQLLSKIDLIDPHYRIIGNPARTALALAQVELVERAVSGEESHPRVFDLLIHTLKAMDQEDGFLEGILWYFEGHFIDLMGYKPTWNTCISCQKSLGVKGGFFQPSSGGLYCSDCGRDYGGLVVNPETLEILFFLQRESLKEACRLVPTQLQKAEIRKMFDLYFKTHIEHLTSLKSLALFYSFEQEGNG